MSVPGYCHFRKIQNFMNEHYEEDGNYRERLKLSCQEKVGEIDLLCVLRIQKLAIRVTKKATTRGKF